MAEDDDTDLTRRELLLELREMRAEMRDRVDEATRKRLDTVSKVVALVGVIAFAAGGIAITLLVNRGVQSAIQPGSSFRTEVEQYLDTQIGFAEDRLTDTVTEQGEAIVEATQERLVWARVLPLVLSEALAFSQSREGYNAERAELVLDGLATVASEVSELSEFEQQLVFRRVHVAMRAFWNVGDYDRVLRVHQIFGDELLNHRDPTLVLTESMMSLIVVAGRHAAQEALTEQLLARQWQRQSFHYELQRLLALVHAQSDDWTEEALLAALRSEVRRFPEFDAYAFSRISQLDRETAPGTETAAPGFNYTPEARARFETFMSAIAQSMAAAD